MERLPTAAFRSQLLVQAIQFRTQGFSKINVTFYREICVLNKFYSKGYECTTFSALANAEKYVGTYQLGIDLVYNGTTWHAT